MRDLFGQIQGQLLTREQHRENSGRRATQVVTFTTTGSGELVPTSWVEFDMPFFEEPIVNYGHVLVKLPDRSVYLLPNSSGGVFRWQRQRPSGQGEEAKGHYVGAYLYFRVDCDVKQGVPIPTVPAAPVIHHHFTFQANSYKKMSREVDGGLADVRVRPLTPPIIP